MKCAKGSIQEHHRNGTSFGLRRISNSRLTKSWSTGNHFYFTKKTECWIIDIAWPLDFRMKEEEIEKIDRDKEV